MQSALAQDVGGSEKSVGAQLQAEGIQLLGKTVQTFWAEEKVWWHAMVVGYDADSQTHGCVCRSHTLHACVAGSGHDVQT